MSNNNNNTSPLPPQHDESQKVDAKMIGSFVIEPQESCSPPPQLFRGKGLFTVPTRFDIVCENGNLYNNHAGNQVFRNVLVANLHRYKRARQGGSRKDRDNVVSSLLRLLQRPIIVAAGSDADSGSKSDKSTGSPPLSSSTSMSGSKGGNVIQPRYRRFLEKNFETGMWHEMEEDSIRAAIQYAMDRATMETSPAPDQVESRISDFSLKQSGCPSGLTSIDEEDLDADDRLEGGGTRVPPHSGTQKKDEEVAEEADYALHMLDQQSKLLENLLKTSRRSGGCSSVGGVDAIVKAAAAGSYMATSSDGDDDSVPKSSPSAKRARRRKNRKRKSSASTDPNATTDQFSIALNPAGYHQLVVHEEEHEKKQRGA